MIFWLFAALMAVAAVTALLWPLMRPAVADDGAGMDRAVYRDQLQELERDVARGLVATDQAAAARAEIARRLLRAEGTTAAIARGKGAGRALGLVLAAAVPLLALAIYLPVGSPDLPGQPAAARDPAVLAEAAEMEELITQLRARLEANPDEREGWLLLGRSEAGMGRMEPAVDAYRRALALAPSDPLVTTELAEALVLANGGLVSGEARTLFETALAAEPENPRARFYLGEARFQAGDPHGALEAWAELVRRSTADAPYLPTVRARMAEVAQGAGLDPSAAVPEPRAAGPTARDMAAAAAMDPAEREAMVRGMVDGLAARLEAEPGDVAGWERLGRARLVLGEGEAAAAAFARAVELAPDRPGLRVAQAEALMAGRPQGEALPAPAVAALEAALAIEPDHPPALWYLAGHAAAAGDRARAADLLTRLRDRLPADSEARRVVESELESLSQTGPRR